MSGLAWRCSALFTLLMGLGLGGCTTMGTNVSGSFRCEAPDGICAPSTQIDDSALAEIDRTTSTELLSPAGPYHIDDGVTPSPTQRSAPTPPAQIANESDKQKQPAQAGADLDSFELAIVFPGYVDARGRIIERRTVQTRVALPGRGDAVDELARRASTARWGGGLLAAAESAPPLLALTTPSGPSASDLAATDANAQQGPIAVIKTEVQTLLAASDPPAPAPEPNAIPPNRSAPEPEAGETPLLPTLRAASFPGLTPYEGGE